MTAPDIFVMQERKPQFFCLGGRSQSPFFNNLLDLPWQISDRPGSLDRLLSSLAGQFRNLALEPCNQL